MEKQNNQVSKFVKRNLQLLKTEGFEEVVNIEDKIRFKRGGIVIDLSSVKDKNIIQVITRMSNRLQYTTLISFDEHTDTNYRRSE